MNQSTIIFAYLAAAFVVFITMRGELRAYMGFFFGGQSATAPGSPQPFDTASGGGNAKSANNSFDLQDAAKLAIMFV